MLKKRPSVKSMMIRRNAEIFKILFQVRVHKAYFPYRVPIDEDSEISCCFERGGKISSSMDTQPLFSTQDESCDVVFNETLELVATLYKSKTKGTFQEKPACLVVRIKKKTSNKRQTYQALGVVEIDLSTFVDPAGGSSPQSEHSFPLVKSFINGAMLCVAITSKIMSADSDVQDDTMSMQSGFSDAPVMSADIGLNSIPTYPATSKATFTSPEKVNEEEDDSEEREDVDLTMELHQKNIALANLQEDNGQLKVDYMRGREELAAATEALDQLTGQVQQQLEDRILESDSARMSRVTLSRILAGTNNISDKDTISNLKEETTALFAELEAQKQMCSAYSQSLQVKEVRLAESEVRNINLLEKVTQLSERNEALKVMVETSIPAAEYEKKKRQDSDAHKRYISELKATHKQELISFEKELERQVEINNDLKRRLQLYSENVAELEVSGVANGVPMTNTPADDKSPTKRRSSQPDNGEEVKTVTFEGSLTKRGSFYPSWKKRHFILHGDSHLSYYTNQDDMVFKGHFIITASTVLGEATVSGYKCFYLEHTKRRLYMTAATPLEEMEWMAVFRRSIMALANKKDTTTKSGS